MGQRLTISFVVAVILGAVACAPAQPQRAPEVPVVVTEAVPLVAPDEPIETDRAAPRLAVSKSLGTDDEPSFGPGRRSASPGAHAARPPSPSPVYRRAGYARTYATSARALGGASSPAVGGSWPTPASYGPRQMK